MAITKVTRTLLSTGIVDNSNATAITIDSNENATVVTIDGVVQHKDTYSVSGNTLTFSEAPPTGTAVECITWTNTAVNSALLMQDADGDTQIQVEESSDEDKIRFDTGGTERMVIDSSGNVTIGSSSLSANAALKFQADTGTFTLEHERGSHALTLSDSDGTGEILRIDTSGRVGIGTSSPTVPLQINHGSSSVGLYTLGSYNYQAKFESSDAEAAIVIEDSNSGTDYNRIGVITNDMAFTTNNAERMRIDSSGDIAIGSATVRRDLASNTSPVLSLEGTFPAINLRDSGTGYGGFFGLDGNTVYIGGHTDTAAMQVYVNGSEKMRIQSGGNVIFGVASEPTGSVGGSAFITDSVGRMNLILATTSTGNVDVANFRNPNGTVGKINTNGSSTVYNTSSDARLKDVTGSARGLEVINELNPVSYNWKVDGKADEGLIAQEVLDIVPNAVTGSEEEQYYMDYSKLVVHLVAGMKEQQTQIEALQSEINLLKGE